MASKAQLHFQSIAILNELDKAERHATREQFASAAKIAARTVSVARNRAKSPPMTSVGAKIFAAFHKGRPAA